MTPIRPPRKPRPITASMLERLLDPTIHHRIRSNGLTPTAVRAALVDVPAAGASPARRGPAVICRLYPTGTDARFAFLRAGQLYAEAIVFEDPDDVLAYNLNAGFENAIHVAAKLGEGTRQ